MKQSHFSPKSRTAAAGTSSHEDRLPLLLSFLLPMVIMVGIFAGKGIFPFGENSFLRTDMYHQYAPFYAEFARILKSGGSLTYSTQIGLGSNFIALFAYYLSSPFNWLLFLIPSGAVIEFMTYMIVLKIGLCGLTMGSYLRSKFNRNDLTLPCIASLYALSGYMAAYSWNIMWLDCLWIAPLLILGLEKLVRKEQPFLYCITLACAILTNYYIAIMLCIFMVLYFLMEMVILPRKKAADYVRRCVLFAVFSLVAGGLAAILLLPAYRCLLTTASADSTFPSSLTSYFGFLEMLARHMAGVEVEIGLDHWPNIYSGVICFLLFPLYIMNTKIDAKEKIAKTVLLVIMLLSFSLNIPNYIWHGMHYPNSLPCRQSFLYTILLLTMCYEGLRKIRELTPRQIAAVFWGDAAFLLLMQLVNKNTEIEYYVYYISLLFVALYALLLWLMQRSAIMPFTAVILILGLTVVETGMNTAITSVTTTNRTEYWKNTDNYQTLIDQAKEGDTSGFFRVEKASRRTKNDGAWTGYSSASIFSSTTQSSISDFYTSFGMEGNTNAYSFTGSTPLMASLLSVRYMISSSELTETPLNRYVSSEDGAYLYENLYTLPVGFMISADAAQAFAYDDSSDPAEAQNQLVAKTTGSGEILTQVADNYGSEEFDFTTESTGHYFFYVSNDDISDITAEIDGETKTFSNVDRGYLLDLGQIEAGTDVYITSDDDSGYDVDAAAYIFNDDVFTSWHSTLNAHGMRDVSFTNTLTKTELTGTVDAAEYGKLFLSIPYDSGWEVTVDGSPVEAEEFAGSFMMLSLTAGTHQIVMTYHVPGLVEGVMLTISSLIILILLYMAFAIKAKRKADKANRYRSGRRAAASAAIHERTERLTPQGRGSSEKQASGSKGSLESRASGSKGSLESQPSGSKGSLESQPSGPKGSARQEDPGLKGQAESQAGGQADKTSRKDPAHRNTADLSGDDSFVRRPRSQTSSGQGAPLQTLISTEETVPLPVLKRVHENNYKPVEFKSPTLSDDDIAEILLENEEFLDEPAGNSGENL